MVPDFEFVKPVRVDFQNISGWLAGSICWSPGTCQDGIHNYLIGTYPYDRQVHEDEQHVYCSIELALVSFNEKQAIIWGEAGTEHQAAQTAQETVTVECV